MRCALAFVTAVTLVACLPADTRPPPGQLLVTASPSPAVAQGVTTADGWTLSFRRVLVGIGRVSLDDCVEYGEARYERVLDVATLSGQKVSLQYARGDCAFRFHVSAPSANALLGRGVTEADKTLMRTPGGDAYVPVGGVSLLVDGFATRGADTKTFRWQFRQELRFESCATTNQGQTVSGVHLAGNAHVTVDIELATERLFRDDVDDAVASLRFNPIAAADSQYGNADGVVDLTELAQVPLTVARASGGGYGPGADAGAPDGSTSETLLDYVYLALLPTVPRFADTGSCTVGIGDEHHD